MKQRERERQAEAETPRETEPEGWERFKGNAKTFGGAILIAGLIRIMLFEAFEIDGPSMEPTLFNGDRVVVAKFDYGIFPLFAGDTPILGSIPLLGGDEALVTWGVPESGDVVIVHSPMDEKDIVKRVIGVPGDTIEIRESVVYVNGTALQQRIDGNCRDAMGREMVQDCELVLEQLGEHSWHTSRDPITRGEAMLRVEVPADHVFVMGDHRDRSNDSRNPAVGFIPVERVKGRAMAIYWSNDHGVRWGRIFTGID